MNKRRFLLILTVLVTVSVFFFSTCKKESNKICVSDVKLDIHSLSLEVGDTARLIATVYPNDAGNKTVIWTSSNPEVATVSNDGFVTAISDGKAIIVVTNKESEKTDECNLLVFTPGPLRIVQWCDPQLGYKIDYSLAVARSERAVELVNEISPDLLLICGDMIHNYDNDKQLNDFLKIISLVNVPILLTPGNHDLDDPVTLKGLQRYRSFFGDDFQTKELKGYKIISLNSQLLFYQDVVPPEEYNRHLNRVNEALQDAKSKNQPIIVMSHMPPLNMPEIHKQFIEYGAFVWLSGHWHIPWRYTYTYPFGNIVSLVGESSSWNEDNYPLGIRLLTFHSDNSFDWDFIPLN